MKRLLTAALLLRASYAAALATNTKTTVTQVTEAVSLTADVDYHISGATPFTTTGSIDIVNTDHAVVIFDNLRPTEAKAFLGYITINGADAKDGSNCQLKLYNRGSILLPYGGTAFRPLTVYDGDNFTGESYNTLTEGHSGGFMKDIPAAWNNRIKSFRLKRGYMVTFALKKGGYGYSRCFIAADNDLEVTLPALMSGRISSYRIFKWYDASKKGIADWVDANICRTLGVTSTFTWSPGSSLLPDAECVPHHIHESWPAPSELGSVSYSCHMKTNNEPRNPDEKDGTWTMEQILANWEALMRTGLRLCSPSSWDGSDYWNATGFLADFLNEIDKRGWRCDIIDLHGYWTEGSFETNPTNWANKFGRPVWITEWCWGASWNNNGSFTSWATESSFANAIKTITNTLNKAAHVERYFYWNGENGNFPCRIYRSSLTEAGEYYAQMDAGLAYSGYGNYVPAAPPTNTVTDLSGTFTATKKICKLTWTNQNGDLSKSITVQRRIDGGKWVNLTSYDGPASETTTKFTYNDTIDAGGQYTYRIVDTLYTKKALISDTYVLSVAGTQGTADVQYGSISSIPLEVGYSFFQTPFAEQPAIVFGSATYNNISTTSTPRGVINNPLQAGKVNSQFAYVQYQENVWEGTSVPKSETTNFIVASTGNGTLGALHYEAGYVPKDGTSIAYANAAQVKGEVVEVTFQQPFAEAPVVFVTPLHSSASLPPAMWRVYDITPTGFKLLLQYQVGETDKFTQRKVSYFAIEKGTGRDGQGALYTVGDEELTFKTAQVALPFGTTLTNPLLLAQLQTYNHQAPALLRIPSVGAESAYLRMQVDPTATGYVLSASVNATEHVGYIAISEDPDYNGIQDLTTSAPAAVPATAYDLSGRAVNSGNLGKGLYIIGGRKVLVK